MELLKRWAKKGSSNESPLREDEMKTFALAICVIIGLQGLGQGQAKARGPTSIAVK